MPRASRRWRRRRSGRKLVLLGLLGLFLVVWALSWRSSPPSRTGDICAIFTEKPSWYHSARRSSETWGVPEAVQLAILHQESGFRARARPPRSKILWIIPWRRASSAYGYAQVLDTTWEDFREATGRAGAERHRFDDAAQFVGWYGQVIHRITGIAKDDAYNLYLAYHEGPSGYNRGHHRSKGWLLGVARKVERRAQTYQRQYDGCAERLRRRGWWRLWLAAAIVGLLAIWVLSRRRRGRRRRAGRRSG